MRVDRACNGIDENFIRGIDSWTIATIGLLEQWLCKLP